MLVNLPHIQTLLLALGANKPGRWGGVHESFARAIRELQAAGVKVLAASDFYKTDPIGDGPQPAYLNVVIVARASLAPGTLLRVLKQTERRAGRRATPPMRARPLDIDILDYGGRRLNWPAYRRERGTLILPHPHLHSRAFVLVPLHEVAPWWSHPVLDRRAKALRARLGPGAARGVRRAR